MTCASQIVASSALWLSSTILGESHEDVGDVQDGWMAMICVGNFIEDT